MMLDYLRAVYGAAQGHAVVATGSGQYVTEKGKYAHQSWTETAFVWPSEADRLVRALGQASAAGDDAYVCPYLMHGKSRAKGAAVERSKVHADLDGTAVPLDRLDDLGAYAVSSGTPGHAHVYVDLEGSVPAHWHEVLCRGLGAFLGDADAKVSDNDVLRPPGTLNHKPAAFGYGGPAPVEWLRTPTGRRWQPQELASVLGVVLPAVDAPRTVSGAVTGPAAVVETVDPAGLPDRVLDTLAEVTGDRSADTMRVVGACHDAGLTLAQARGVVALRADLTERLAERRDDDVLTCWLKATDSRATRQADDAWLAGLPRADAPNTADPIAQGIRETDTPDEDHDARVRRLFPRLDWHALWADDSAEEWIHEPLLPARRLVTIYSPPKVGKSLLVLELAVCIARGDAFLGYEPDRGRRVLYVDFENDPRGDVRTRLQAMGYGPDDLANLDYLSFPTMAALDSERGGIELLAAVAAYASEVVVIDTVSRAVAGEENANDTWLALYRHTGLKLKQAGVAMLRLDHTGKDEDRGTRGGSAKSGDVDAIWRLTRVTDDRFRLDLTDSRMAVDTKSLVITRHTTPRLHHSVEGWAAITDRDAKVRNLIELADTNDLPADANRDSIRSLAQSRGIKARNDVLSEVVKRRKVVPDPRGQHTPPELSPTTGDNTGPEPDSEHENAVPNHRGQPGTASIGPTVPVPPSIGGDSGTAGPQATNKAPDDRPPCSSCGKPMGRADTPLGVCIQCRRIDAANAKAVAS